MKWGKVVVSIAISKPPPGQRGSFVAKQAYDLTAISLRGLPLPWVRLSPGDREANPVLDLHTSNVVGREINS